MELPCFFQVPTEEHNEVITTISEEFVNNTAAGVAGNSLYGGYIDGCIGF